MNAGFAFSLLLALQASPLPPAGEPGDAGDDAIVTSRLTGLDAAGVRRELGEPALARSEGAGGVWTYRRAHCALFVYFADGGGGLKVIGIASGPRRHGDAALPPAACLADAPPATPRTVTLPGPEA